MCIELREQGFNVGRYRVRQIMKNLLLVAKRPGRHRYTRGGKPAVIAANLLIRSGDALFAFPLSPIRE